MPTDCAATPIRKAANLDPRQVFVGNGSDEVLAHAFQAFFKQDEAILFADISYSFYPVYCNLYQIAFETVALDDDFRIDFDGFRRANGGIILPNPNAPTGIALNLAEIREMGSRSISPRFAKCWPTIPNRWLSSTKPMSISALNRRAR
jgi:histidinol-phosphate aminotransferase